MNCAKNLSRERGEHFPLGRLDDGFSDRLYLFHEQLYLRPDLSKFYRLPIWVF
jgi:hypothetical protein